jgi:hypothetical protein
MLLTRAVSALPPPGTISSASTTPLVRSGSLSAPIFDCSSSTLHAIGEIPVAVSITGDMPNSGLALHGLGA